MFFSCLWQNFLPNVGEGDFPLPDTMSALLLNRLKKQQQRAWEVSRKQLLGAFSGGGIHHLRRPGAKTF